MGGKRRLTIYCDPAPAFCPRVDRAQSAPPLSPLGFSPLPGAFGPEAYPRGRVIPLRAAEGQMGQRPPLFQLFLIFDAKMSIASVLFLLKTAMLSDAKKRTILIEFSGLDLVSSRLIGIFERRSELRPERMSSGWDRDNVFFCSTLNSRRGCKWTLVCAAALFLRDEKFFNQVKLQDGLICGLLGRGQGYILDC